MDTLITWVQLRHAVRTAIQTWLKFLAWVRHLVRSAGLCFMHPQVTPSWVLMLVGWSCAALLITWLLTMMGLTHMR